MTYDIPPPSMKAEAAIRLSSSKVVAAHYLVLLKRLHVPLEHDLAVHDDVAAIGDADRLVKVLLCHEHGKAVAVFQLFDLRDRMRHEDRRKPDRRLIDEQELGRGHKGARDGE